MLKYWSSIAATVLAGAVLAASPGHASEGWTLKAIIEAPSIVQTAIFADGSTAAYIVRRDHLEGNFRDSSVVQVNVRTGATHILLNANWIGKISQIPGQRAWSILADIGEGVQLYRLDEAGLRTPLLVRPSTVYIGGEASTAVFPSVMEPRIAYGVLDYGWSSDGTAFWYSCAINAPTEKPTSPFLDMPTVPKVIYHSNRSELHVVDSASGADTLVSHAKGYVDYPVLFYAEDAAAWSYRPGGGLKLNYRLPGEGEAGNRNPSYWHYDLGTGLSERGSLAEPHAATGPNDGRLASVGYWGKRRLVETLDNGDTRNYGPVDFAISPGRNPGQWRLAGERAAIIAVRYEGLNLRNGLIKVAADGTISDLGGSISVDKCAFTPDAAVGVCIQEGLSTPPTLVAINGKLWSQRPLVAIDPVYDAITPLQYEPRLWTAGGHSTSGFILYPRDYKVGKRYPAILATHGNDGDNRFVNMDFQWSYPLQMFAERGYVVMYINDIPAAESDERLAAISQSTTGEGKLTAEFVKKTLWLDDVAIYRQAIRELSADGIIEPRSIGIIGYSRGAQMVAVAVTQTDLFKAASSGEGTMFSPSSYWMGDNAKSYSMLFGGAPFDSRWQDAWRSLAPTFRAKQTRSAVLFQIAALGAGATDFYHALRTENVPTDYAYFPGETHLPSVPANRLEIMQENLNWFAYWFGQDGEPKGVGRDKYIQWRTVHASPQYGAMAK